MYRTYSLLTYQARVLPVHDKDAFPACLKVALRKQMEQNK